MEESLKHTFKNDASTIKLVLSEQGQQIKLGHCYELIAYLQDYLNWNHLTGTMRKIENLETTREIYSPTIENIHKAYDRLNHFNYKSTEESCKIVLSRLYKKKIESV